MGGGACPQPARLGPHTHASSTNQEARVQRTTGPGPRAPRATTYVIVPCPVLAAALQELLKTVQRPLPVVINDL